MSLYTLLKQPVHVEINNQSGIFKKSVSTLCKLVGHTWRYKDYSNWMKENGDCYDFTAVRKCSLCDQKEYLSDTKWLFQERMAMYDVKSDENLLRKLPHILTS